MTAWSSRRHCMFPISFITIQKNICFKFWLLGDSHFLDFENLILKVSLRFFVLLFGCFIILIYWYFRREPLGRWWLSNVSLREIVASNHRLVAAYYPLSDNNQPCTLYMIWVSGFTQKIKRRCLNLCILCLYVISEHKVYAPKSFGKVKS